MLTFAQLNFLHMNAVSLRALALMMARKEHRISNAQFHKWLTHEIKAWDEYEAKTKAREAA